MVEKVLKKFSDKPITICPKCKGKVNKIFHPPPLVFKGKGWYSTDNRQKEKIEIPSEKKASDKKESLKPEKTSTDKLKPNVTK